MFFIQRFILNEKLFVIDNILSETIYIFCFCVLFLSTYCKINFMAKK